MPSCHNTLNRVGSLKILLCLNILRNFLRLEDYSWGTVTSGLCNSYILRYSENHIKLNYDPMQNVLADCQAAICIFKLRALWSQVLIPRWFSPVIDINKYPENWTHIYDNTPVSRTLDKYVDFKKL